MIEALEQRTLLAAVYTVTNTNDDGAGSLREVINAANQTGLPFSATILFDVPGKGVHTIKPLTALPAITVQVDIEGTTDSAGNPLIEIDGENLTGSTDSGLVFARNTSGNTKPSVVTGLIVNRFPNDGIDISGTAPTWVYGCRVGTNASGTDAAGNGNVGILATGSNNRIGLPGVGRAFQTLVSGNKVEDIAVLDNNIVQNCWVGLDITGTVSLGETGDGVAAQSRNLIGGRNPMEANVLSGHDSGNGHGLVIVGTLNDVLGNSIGTNPPGVHEGTTSNQVGVILTGATKNFIGDDTEPGSNTIAGNRSAGLEMVDGSNSNTVWHNIIGTLSDALNPGGNGDGIVVTDSSNNTFEDDIVAGNNGDGIRIEQVNGTTTGNFISNVIIGAENTAGDNEFGNNGDGINIVGASNTVIGNSFVFDSLHAGVHIDGATASGNSFQHGGIFDNGDLGISIGPSTGTEQPNHSATTSVAGLPNGGLNHPVLTSAVVDGNSTTVTGSFVGTPNTDYHFAFYSSEFADSSGFGEGFHELTISSQLFVKTDANGNVVLNDTFNTRLSSTDVVSAIAYHDLQAGQDMSEFSNAVHTSGAVITGNVFNDANGNGKRDTGEKPLSKQLVFLDKNGDGVFDPSAEFSAKTNSNGNFRLFGAPTGHNHLALQTASGFTQTVPKVGRPFYILNIASLGQFGGFLFGERKTPATGSHAASLAAPASPAVSDDTAFHKHKPADLADLVQSLDLI